MCRLLPAVLLSLCGNVMALAEADSANLLQIDPSLCVVAGEEPVCATTLTIRWRLSEELGAVCLSEVNAGRPLFCVENGTLAVQRQLPVSLVSDTRFELRRRHDNQLLAATTVTVARMLTDLRPRRRHGWGIF